MPKKTVRPQKNQTPSLANRGLFVTTVEVAEALRYTPKAVRCMMERGVLPGRKIGGEWRMHRVDFARLTQPAHAGVA